jgi:hypothetical protein
VHLIDLIPILQVAIGPVILISGGGLLLLSMTNRLGRVIDRSRLIVEARRKAPETERERFSSQLEVLTRRALLVRSAIIYTSVSVLLAAILIIAEFLAALFKLEAGVIVILIFVGCMSSLVVSMIYFISDINLSLSALKLEISPEQTSNS